jgi:hypothetical protein
LLIHLESIVTLSPAELARLHVEDGLMDVSELEMGEGIDFDPSDDARFRADLRMALQPPTVPTIVHDVMRRLGQFEVPVADAVEAGAADSESVAGAVMAQIGGGGNPSRMLAAAIVQESGDVGSVWPGVAAAIGADVGVDLGSILRGAIADESAHMPVSWMSVPRQRWIVPAAAGVLLAAAAALLLWVGTGSSAVQSVAEKLAEGPVDIEALEVGAASAVQILQAGDDATTIMLIKEEVGSAGGVE